MYTVVVGRFAESTIGIASRSDPVLLCKFEEYAGDPAGKIAGAAGRSPPPPQMCKKWNNVECQRARWYFMGNTSYFTAKVFLIGTRTLEFSDESTFACPPRSPK
jgi:hypothetical protein